MRTVPVIRGAGGSVAGGTSLRGVGPTMPAPTGMAIARTAATAAPATAARRRWIRRARVRTSVTVNGAALQGVGGPVQRVVHLVLEGSGAHRASSPDSWGLRECGARARSAASARLACDLTVPTEIPSTSAISASLSCS